jgi:hypothetical protein
MAFGATQCFNTLILLIVLRDPTIRMATRHSNGGSVIEVRRALSHRKNGSTVFVRFMGFSAPP